jgi:hypothetical protein
MVFPLKIIYARLFPRMACAKTIASAIVPGRGG